MFKVPNSKMVDMNICSGIWTASHDQVLPFHIQKQGEEAMCLGMSLQMNSVYDSLAYLSSFSWSNCIIT